MRINKIKMGKTLRYSMLFLLFLSFFWATSCRNADKSSTGRPLVTVSIPPIKYLVDRISGNEFNVNVMVATGACQETYEPSPVQMKDVAKSSIYFGISDLEFEQKWMTNISENNPALKYKNLGDGIYTAPATCDHHAEAEHHHHSHGGVDPHFWLSAKNYKTMAKATLAELEKLNPSKKEAYNENYSKLVAQIDSLDASTQKKLSTLKNRTFIIYHPALTYFAADYGLTQIAIEKDGKEPDAQHIKELVMAAKTRGINHIFVQKEFDMNVIKSLAAEIGATIVPIDTFAYNWLDNMSGIANTIYSATQ